MEIKRNIAGVAYDSKQVKKDYCFVAIKGSSVDGHKFIDDAVKNGACIVVSEHPVNLPADISNIVVKNTKVALAEISSEFFKEPSKGMRVIGITGTNGKTTISYLIESVLKQAGKKVGVVGTVSWRFGDKTLPAPNTTPMSYDLQKLLSEMKNAGVEDVVMEVSSHALDQDRVACVNFDSVIFTNLTRDHLDYHKTYEEYFGAKRRLFTEFLENSSKRKKSAAINLDDEYGKKLINEVKYVESVSYGFDPNADVSVKNLKSTIVGNNFDISTPWGDLNINSSLKGKFNVSNVLAAISSLGALGVSLDVIKRGVEDLKVVPGRLEDVSNNKGISVFVDYSHTPDALENAISTLKKITTGKLITIFGCGGDRDKGKRPLMGEVAAKGSDVVIVTSDNPRSEAAEKIIEDILPGIKKVRANGLVVEADRKKAIEEGIRMAKKGDVVLIAGKGHETYQIIGKDVHNFDDREEAKKVFETLKQ